MSAIKHHPGSYEKIRVFFKDEAAALAAGYRPCGNCLREKYKAYMADPEGYKATFNMDHLYVMEREKAHQATDA